MSIKTTKNRTRDEAEQLYLFFRQEQEKRKLLAEAVAMNNKELENALEKLDDEFHGGSFNNYQIIRE